MKLPIKLVFDTWRDREGNDIYASQQGIDLSLGDFHAGTMFDATIEVGDNTLASAMRDGYVPVFYAVKVKP